MLPLQNLLEVISLRILDAESLNCLVILRSYVVSDIVVIVLCSTCVDVNYAWWNLTGQLRNQKYLDTMGNERIFTEVLADSLVIINENDSKEDFRGD